MTPEPSTVEQVKPPLSMFDRTLAIYAKRAAEYAIEAHACLNCNATLAPAGDLKLLKLALKDAQRVVKRHPNDAEAWAGFALLLISACKPAQARRAARRAVMLKPSSWAHAWNLSIKTWGNERLGWADCLLALCPDFPPARFLSAMVYVARGEFQVAEDIAAAGAAVHARVADENPQCEACGLHWLLGLLHLRKGDVTRALACFHREARDAYTTSVYSREFHVNALTAAGFAHLQVADIDAAVQSLEGALDILPSQPPALVGLVDALVCSGRAREAKVFIPRAIDRLDPLWDKGSDADAFLAGALIDVSRQEFGTAAEILEVLLTNSPPGEVGWMIPIDPCFAPLRGKPGFDRVLALLAMRAA